MRMIILAAAAMALSGCATITRGSTVVLTIETTPSGAAVTTSSGFQCAATPCAIRMPRKDSFTMTLTLPGYQTETISVVSGVSSGGGTAMAGNIIFGGLIGVGVDATSGAMNDLTPNPVQVTLRPQGEPAAAEATPAPQS
jgi:hypothetical protein